MMKITLGRSNVQDYSAVEQKLIEFLKSSGPCFLLQELKKSHFHKDRLMSVMTEKWIIIEEWCVFW